VKFTDLNDMIPYAMGGKIKILSMQPYPNITIKMPGRHAKQTTPKGGDYVVCVNDKIFREDHQFAHTDIFEDIYTRRASSDAYDRDITKYYLRVVTGEDPDKLDVRPGTGVGTCMDRMTFLYAIQCLSIAEHRRYAQHEEKFGGRYLPFRFSAGIDEGLWTPEEASWLEKKGRPGVEQLERERGVPQLTQELFDERN
jgi:hypothetical protein